jgi:hypothetical protein
MDAAAIPERHSRRIYFPIFISIVVDNCVPRIWRARAIFVPDS